MSVAPSTLSLARTAPGKTTVFNLLTKFLTPTRGQLLFNGQDITGKDAASIALMGVVRSFQISAVFPHLTGAGERQGRPPAKTQ